MMLVKEFLVGIVGTNCYLAANSKTKEAIIIDPGDRTEILNDYIKENEYCPAAILLTHGHFDHCMAAEELAKEYEIPVYVHEAEKKTMENPSCNCSSMIGRNMVFHADKYMHGEKDHLSLAGFEIDVFLTPGHTPGGVCYYIESEGILFSGDTLFCESIGRTDFPGGSMSQLVRSIKEKLFSLPNDTKVLPGHNEWTTIANERRNNPFLS